MPGFEDASTLLEQLRSKYGVDESLSLYGPSVVVPNQDFKREWTLLLQQAGIHMYVGEQAGKVAWIIPLKPRQAAAMLTDKPLINGLRLYSQLPYKNPVDAQDPRSNEAYKPTPNHRATQGEAPSSGCVTGRAWQPPEDQMLEEAVQRGLSQRRISLDLASKLDRTPSAIRSRLRRLAKRQLIKKAHSPPEAEEIGTPTPGKNQYPNPLDARQLVSLLEATLCLAEDPKHLPAICTLIETALKKLHASQVI